MWILSPLSWLLLCLAGFLFGIVLWPRRRRLSYVFGAGMAVSAAMMTPIVANRLVGWLEAMPEQPAVCATQPPAVAVVLAGGVDRYARSEQDLSALNIASRRRTEKAVGWWRERPDQRQLVVAGGSQRWHGASEAGLMSHYMQQLGVPAAAIRVEDASRNTWQNAHNVAAMQPPLPRQVVLVTSAMHMRRARHSMRQAGFEVCTLGADWRYVPFQRFSYLFPSSGGLEKTELALHELVGLVYYRIFHARGGRSQAAG